MRVSGVLSVALLLLFSALESQCAYMYKCTTSNNYGYERNATFLDVHINAAVSYGFQCEYNNYKSTITFVNSVLDEVPKKLFDTFTSVVNVTLSNCGIKNINRYSLERASSLQVLDLSRNAVEKLNSFAFTGASSLMMLNLALNNISTIDAAAFNALSELRVLYLQGNRLRRLASASFSELSALRHIFLDHNELEVLEGGVFAKNTQLENIMLHNNRISAVDDSTFAITTNNSLKMVSLKNNRLAKLDLRDARVKKMLLANNVLEELYLSSAIEALFAQNNNISKILTDAPETMLIETLSLENNSITTLDSINRLQSLVSLDLTNNTLGALSIDSFAKLSNLQYLGLERTGVTNLQHGTFAQQEKLTWLDLSYNGLEQLELDILTSLTRLTTLYLDGNRLRSIDYGKMKKMFPALTELGLVDNRWNCTFLANIVRYCNEHEITLLKGEPSPDVLQRTNVKGIFCYDEKNPIRYWNETVQHLLASNISETEAMKATMQSVLDEVQRFGAAHSEAADRTGKLEGTVSDLTKRQLALDNALLDLRKSLLDLRLSLLSNRTNDSTIGGDDLRRMIDSVNNLTLDKQKLSEDKLDLKINVQSYRVDQALETAKANSDKLTVLGQRIERWISTIVGPDGVGFFAADKQQQPRQEDSKGTSSSESKGLLVTVLVMVCLMMGVLVFAIVRSSRRAYSVDRGRYTNRDSSLTTIIDNDI